MLNKKSQERKIFIDFDVTLLNTRLFKNAYFKEFEKFGISGKDAKEAYEVMKKIIGKDNPYFHAAYLGKRYPKVDTKRLKAALINFRKQSKNYVFKDVQTFLKYLIINKWRVELLSIGYRSAQNKKVQGSGLTKFFHKVHVVDSDNKSDHLKKILKKPDDHFVFIDDNIYLVDDVKKNFPKSTVIQIIRYSHQLKSDKVDHVVGNMNQAKHILEKI
ncbi:MAG: HAD family hydrolase [bacterium]|nr:HAD family hydrolase [bacterium]